MQLQGLILFFLIITIIPILMLFTEHNIFFAIMSVILFFSCFSKLKKLLFSTEKQDNEQDTDTSEEYESEFNIDIKKFTTGIDIVKKLTIILFFFYCIFFIDMFIFKVLTAFTIVVRLYEMINSIGSDKQTNTLHIRVLAFLSNAFSIFIILYTAYQKFSFSIFI